MKSLLHLPLPVTESCSRWDGKRALVMLSKADQISPLLFLPFLTKNKTKHDTKGTDQKKKRHKVRAKVVCTVFVFHVFNHISLSKYDWKWPFFLLFLPSGIRLMGEDKNTLALQEELPPPCPLPCSCSPLSLCLPHSLLEFRA